VAALQPQGRATLAVLVVSLQAVVAVAAVAALEQQAMVVIHQATAMAAQEQTPTQLSYQQQD
jgi:hypothetical protein